MRCLRAQVLARRARCHEGERRWIKHIGRVGPYVRTNMAAYRCKYGWTARTTGRAAHSPLSRRFGAALRSRSGPASSDLLIVISVTRSHDPSGCDVLESRSPPHIRRPRAVTKRPRQASADASTWRGYSRRDEHCPISVQSERISLVHSREPSQAAPGGCFAPSVVQVLLGVTTVSLARRLTNLPYSAAGPVCTA